MVRAHLHSEHRPGRHRYFAGSGGRGADYQGAPLTVLAASSSWHESRQELCEPTGQLEAQQVTERPGTQSTFHLSEAASALGWGLVLISASVPQALTSFVINELKILHR